MTLKLYNTLTRKKEVFTPIDKDNIRMYVCGPTVYDYAHIGNARPIIVFDVLYRLLRHIYGADHVTYARNITDVDDKINARAAEEGVTIAEVTERTTKQFHQDIAALGVLEPTVEPRATAHIKQMIAMIKTLIEKGHAYEADGHVLFDVPSMPDYGKLSNRTLDEMIAGARVEVASYKKDPTDFILWKPSTGNAPGWESPWGTGRPGWHIECSAMSQEYLGKTFDIHGGGIDLQFPHHENEIAQSRCAHGTDVMANVWMHNGFLQVEGEKMSKSLGNFITINELLQKWPGEVLRLNMLRTHYRQPIDWTEAGLDESADTLKTWFGRCDMADNAVLSEKVSNALSDDLNTPKAIAELHQLKGNELAGSLLALGFSGNLTDPRTAEVDEKKIATLITARKTARDEKNWAESDRIRDELDAMGIVLKDGADGTTWEVKR
ncbi:Cysteinyl-tRNA synthetase [hydrothermal vent metagenome]|uniref:Cysteine--tRNA ligase n=1 Tax=hydrothermal vent metagenome TaxID=652676 RepID=A0A3B0RSY8_9ZZZZ